MEILDISAKENRIQVNVLQEASSMDPKEEITQMMNKSVLQHLYKQDELR